MSTAKTPWNERTLLSLSPSWPCSVLSLPGTQHLLIQVSYRTNANSSDQHAWADLALPKVCFTLHTWEIMLSGQDKVIQRRVLCFVRWARCVFAQCNPDQLQRLITIYCCCTDAKKKNGWSWAAENRTGSLERCFRKLEKLLCALVDRLSDSNKEKEHYHLLCFFLLLVPIFHY